MADTTCLDIIRRALRKCAGEAGVPAGSDAADAMQALQALILNIPGLFHNAEWRERTASAAYTAKEGERITVSVAAPIELPLAVTDAGCSRKPVDLARVQIVGTGTYLYSASLGRWSRIDGLAVSSPFPFGPEDEEGLVCQLAEAMVDEYGGEVSARTTTSAAISRASLRSRLKKPTPRSTFPRDYI